MKLDLILENVKNKYTMALLEESELPEKELLKGKITINESIMVARRMLVEEGTIETVKQNLEEAWIGAAIEEAQHANHPALNKQSMLNGSYKDGKVIENNRNSLAQSIGGMRERRDTVVREVNAGEYPKRSFANLADNNAREASRLGETLTGAHPQGERATHGIGRINAAPRVVSSAHQ